MLSVFAQLDGVEGRRGKSSGTVVETSLCSSTSSSVRRTIDFFRTGERITSALALNFMRTTCTGSGLAWRSKKCFELGGARPFSRFFLRESTRIGDKEAGRRFCVCSSASLRDDAFHPFRPEKNIDIILGKTEHEPTSSGFDESVR